MKILYALQCTGNGHISRAYELLPLLKKYAEVDLLASGHHSQIQLPQEPQFRFRGISLLYNDKGGLSYAKTIFQNDLFRALKDIKSVPVEDYDMVLNDFEPISAWACKLRNYREIKAVSHQAAILFPGTPKPERKNRLGGIVLKYYAPAAHKTGFHFGKYNPDIFLPVIRSQIRSLNPVNKGFYMTYLPSFSDEFLIKKLNETQVEWKIFSANSNGITYKNGNVKIYPVDRKKFLKLFENCEGILCNAGFETPAEALFLKKKLFVIPIKNQYEQECNCVALEKMGIPASREFNIIKIREWIASDERVNVEYPDESDEIIRRILGIAEEIPGSV